MQPKRAIPVVVAILSASLAACDPKSATPPAPTAAPMPPSGPVSAPLAVEKEPAERPGDKR